MPAAAQSVYGCRGLAEARVPAMEGEGGVFFLLDPDLMTYNRMSDGVVENVAALSVALRGRGSTLVVLPMPTKALAMPQQLGPDAAVFGYDADLAAAIYGDTLRRLREVGVSVVDARHGLRAAAGEDPLYFATDHRPTSAGLRAVAAETAPVLGSPSSPTGAFVTTAGDAVTLESRVRFDLQLSCEAPLAEVTDIAHVTTGPAGLPVAVAIVGTGLTAEPALNFAGFVSQASGLRAEQVAVADDPVAGMLAYLDSKAFRDNPPEFLLWEIPVWRNLALKGDQPFRELVAAALDDCGPALAAERRTDGRLTALLPADGQSPLQSLRIDAGATPVAAVEVTFVSASGERRTRRVVRDPALPAPGRLYMPLSGLWPEGAAAVEIFAEMPADTGTEVALCDG